MARQDSAAATDGSGGAVSCGNSLAPLSRGRSLETVGAVATPSPGVRIPRPPHLALRISTNRGLTRGSGYAGSFPSVPVTAGFSLARAARWGSKGHDAPACEKPARGSPKAVCAPQSSSTVPRSRIRPLSLLYFLLYVSTAGVTRTRGAGPGLRDVRCEAERRGCESLDHERRTQSGTFRR